MSRQAPHLARIITVCALLTACAGRRQELVGNGDGKAAPGKTLPSRPAVASLPYLDALSPLLDRERFFAPPVYSGAQLSPDGRYVAFRKTHQGTLNVWVKETAAPLESARPLTAEVEQPISAFFWSWDSTRVLFVRDAFQGAESHVLAVDPTGAAEPSSGVPAALDLTPTRGIRASVIAVPKDAPHEILVGLNERNPNVHDVYRVDLRSGKQTRVMQNDANVAAWVADTKGVLRAALRQTAEGDSELLRVQGDKVVEPALLRCTAQELCAPVRLRQDGRSLYLRTNRGERDLVELVSLDLRSGKETLVAKDPSGSVDFGGAFFDVANDALMATTYLDARQRLLPEPKYRKDFEKLRTLHPDGDLSILSTTRDGKTWLVSVDSDVEPGAVHVFTRSSGASAPIYRGHPALTAESLAKVTPITVTAKDGTRLSGYFTRPRGTEGTPVATVVLVHGGPWARDVFGFDPTAQLLANRGYGVLQLNFRGSMGFGKRFLSAGDHQWGTGVMQTDLADAVQWLVDQKLAVRERVAIMGASYGGYAALAGLTYTPDLYAAGVSIVGPSNLLTLLRSNAPLWAPVRAMFASRVGDLQNRADLERLQRQSPLFSAKAIRAPLFVAGSVNDPRAKKSDNDKLVATVLASDVPVTYLLAPDEGHGYAREDNRLAMTAEVERFLEATLGGRSQSTMPSHVEKKLASIRVDLTKLEAPTVATSNAAVVAATFDGSRVHPGSSSYDQTLTPRGEKLEAKVKRDVRRVTRAGIETWQVEEATTLGDVTAITTTWLDAKSLQPVELSAKQGSARVEVRFEENRVRGRIVAGGQTLPLDSPLEGAVFSDGPALDVALSTLPLTPGHAVQFQVFDLMSARSVPVTAEVMPAETLTLGKSAPRRAIRVELRSDEDTELRQRVWFDAQTRKMVKSEIQLPTEGGGGAATTVLRD